jgi:hypothetical protein
MAAMRYRSRMPAGRRSSGLPCGFLLKSGSAQNRCDFCRRSNIDSVLFAQNSAIDLLICALELGDG